MMKISITKLTNDDYNDLSVMVGELLNEIMESINIKAFNFNQTDTKNRAEDLIRKEKYWVFIARDTENNKNIGFVSMYESYALYTEGAYGTVPELYVRSKYRSNKIGEFLLKKASEFAIQKQWKRLEVTTPPLPEFEKTLHFYQKNGFSITGGRKLKLDIVHTEENI